MITETEYAKTHKEVGFFTSLYHYQLYLKNNLPITIKKKLGLIQ